MCVGNCPADVLCQLTFGSIIRHGPSRLLTLGLLLFVFDAVLAQQPVVRDLPPGLQIPAAVRPGPNFDVERAVHLQ